MPSTHVIYEGLDAVKKNLDEEEIAKPILSYGQSKFINENQLKESKKNYVILRLGSVYGYSTDTARIDIMANYFAKTTSHNGELKLFAGGRQIKSLVPIIDVARCFKFMEERKDISYQTFNLTKETRTVKEVAQICKKINPKVTLKETNDEIPNLGFSLSNKKILSTGFKFLYNLEKCMEEMIIKWSKQNLFKDLEYVKNGENEYKDYRGKISNHELTEPINMIGLINSKKGTIRANHYHPQQEQKCLFTKGQIIEIYQDILNPHSPKITQVVNEGQLSIIKPNVAHTMVFTKDTTFLNLVRGEREHKNYGITHTIKHVFVDEKEKNFNQLKEIQKKMGFNLLLDESIYIKKNNQKIALIGVENWGDGFKKKGDIDKAIKKINKDDFKILMSHDPSHWEKIIVNHNNHFDLTLSGHTHGMQFGIEIPGFIKWSPVKYRYKYWAGLYSAKNQFINVNRGFGVLGYPGRVGIWPEISVIELKKG